jgi:hypothetical protein
VPRRWAPIGSPHLRLIGATGGRFAISMPGGVSFVEMGDADPRQALCVPRLGLGGDVRLVGDVLALADGDGESQPGLAHLYRIDASGSRELATLPIEAALPFGGDGDRLTLTSDNRRRITSYDVSGAGPVEIAIAENLPGSDDAPLGGFEFRGAGAQRVVLDLRGGLERYDVAPIAGAECLWRLTPRSTGGAFIVSPLMPAARLPAEPVPDVLCPARRSFYEPTHGALGPDERSLLFLSAPPERETTRLSTRLAMPGIRASACLMRRSPMPTFSPTPSRRARRPSSGAIPSVCEATARRCSWATSA